MSIILQTMVTNKLNNGRKLSYLGAKGVWCPGAEEGKNAVIVEGAYPASCRNAQQKACMDYEYANGMIDIVLVTDLKIMSPIVLKGGVPVPDAIKEQNDKALGGQAAAPDAPKPNVVKNGGASPAVVETPKEESQPELQKQKGSNTGAFSAGTIEDTLEESTPIGSGQTLPEDKGEADMFGESVATEVKTEEAPVEDKKKKTNTAKPTKVNAKSSKATGKPVQPKSKKQPAPKKAPAPKEEPKTEVPTEEPKAEAPKKAPAKKTTASKTQPAPKKAPAKKPTEKSESTEKTAKKGTTVSSRRPPGSRSRNTAKK